jgi:hypothetical protein
MFNKASVAFMWYISMTALLFTADHQNTFIIILLLLIDSDIFGNTTPYFHSKFHKTLSVSRLSYYRSTNICNLFRL